MAILWKKLTPEREADIRAIIETLLPPEDIEKITFDVREDSTADMSIYVDIWHRLSPREFDPKLLQLSRRAVNQMLVDKDEERYAYVRHHLAEGQKVKRAA